MMKKSKPIRFDALLISPLEITNLPHLICLVRCEMLELGLLLLIVHGFESKDNVIFKTNQMPNNSHKLNSHK